MPLSSVLRWSISCGVVALLGLSAAPEVHAQRGIWGWLERLSGPGPFTVLGAEVEVACFGRWIQTVDGKTMSTEEGVFGTPTLKWPFGCYDLDRSKPRASLVVGVARLSTDTNPLQYDDATAARPGRVKGLVLMPAFEIGLHRAVDVGLAVGLVRFSGDRFDSFTRVVYEPVRLTVKPIAAVRKERWAEVLQFHLRAAVIGDLDARDFGAVPGTFREERELLWSPSVVVDLGALFFR
jgi:hypothetical protein